MVGLRTLVGDLVAKKSTRQDKVHFPQRTSFKLAEEMAMWLLFFKFAYKAKLSELVNKPIYSVSSKPQKKWVGRSQRKNLDIWVLY